MNWPVERKELPEGGCCLNCGGQLEEAPQGFGFIPKHGHIVYHFGPFAAYICRDCNYGHIVINADVTERMVPTKDINANTQV